MLTLESCAHGRSRAFVATAPLHPSQGAQIWGPQEGSKGVGQRGRERRVPERRERPALRGALAARSGRSGRSFRGGVISPAVRGVDSPARLRPRPARVAPACSFALPRCHHTALPPSRPAAQPSIAPASKNYILMQWLVRRCQNPSNRCFLVFGGILKLSLAHFEQSWAHLGAILRQSCGRLGPS